MHFYFALSTDKGVFREPSSTFGRMRTSVDEERILHTVLLMRTTILLADDLAERFREAARARGQSLSAFLAEAGRNALKNEPSGGSNEFTLVTYGSGGTRPGVNLDRTGELMAAEDENRYGK